MQIKQKYGILSIDSLKQALTFLFKGKNKLDICSEKMKVLENFGGKGYNHVFIHIKFQGWASWHHKHF